MAKNDTTTRFLLFNATSGNPALYDRGETYAEALEPAHVLQITKQDLDNL